MSNNSDTRRRGRQTRRRFLKQAAGLAAGSLAAPHLIPASALGAGLPDLSTFRVIVAACALLSTIQLP